MKLMLVTIMLLCLTLAGCINDFHWFHPYCMHDNIHVGTRAADLEPLCGKGYIMHFVTDKATKDSDSNSDYIIVYEGDDPRSVHVTGGIIDSFTYFEWNNSTWKADLKEVR